MSTQGSFILTADWHVQGERPRCRLDSDWLETQRQTIRWIVGQARERKLPLVVLGDIFNTPRVATPALVMVIEELMPLAKHGHLFIEAGNHDLPFHNYDNVSDCSYGVLRQYFQELHDAGWMLPDGETDWEINAAPFGRDDKPGSSPFVFTHQLVFPNAEARPIEGIGITAEELAAEFHFPAWIFTGDYHHSFETYAADLENEGGTRVVNPGCIIRHSADMMDYQPKIAMIDTVDGTVEWIDIPELGIVEDGTPVVTDRYLREADVRSEKVDSFLASIQSQGTVSLSFRDNLQRKLDDPKLDTDVRDEILGILNSLNKEK